MCGISGWITQHDPRQAVAVVRRMTDALLHRGPDEGGVQGIAGGALGMRRLSIVDLAGGSQPMQSADGRHTLVYNGELYDHGPWRERLEARGARFRTRCDTEVLLNALAIDGEACLPLLNGMFAFAMADRHERSLLIARDRLGIKPLYYYLSPAGDLIFASELASLLVHPRVPRRLDRESLAMLLIDRYVSDPWTLFEGVRQLPPGHRLYWRAGRIDIRPYCHLLPAPCAMEEPSAVRQLDGLLDRSVRSQLEADVPVGVLLSGGIDSSTVAAFASRHARGRIKTFSVGFAAAEYDETALAREVARHLGTEHHELRVGHRGFDLDILDLILDHVGQPLADISCIPTYLVSRFAREHVKVVLSGDGGDELFGGYAYIRWAGRIRQVSRSVPRLARHLGHAALSLCAPLGRGPLAGPLRRARKGLALTFLDPRAQLRSMLGLWSDEHVAALLAGGARGSESRRAFAALPAGAERTMSAEAFAMSALLLTKLPGAILTKVDRMSMATGLEVRPPLLDRHIVDFSLRLPLELKIRRGIGKHVLREVARPLLPSRVFSHRKHGFSLPLAGWLNTRFWDLLEELYAPGTAASALFDRRAVRRAIDAARRARETAALSDYAASARAWQLALVARWMDRFGVAA